MDEVTSQDLFPFDRWLYCQTRAPGIAAISTTLGPSLRFTIRAALHSPATFFGSSNMIGRLLDMPHLNGGAFAGPWASLERKMCPERRLLAGYVRWRLSSRQLGNRLTECRGALCVRSHHSQCAPLRACALLDRRYFPRPLPDVRSPARPRMVPARQSERASAKVGSSVSVHLGLRSLSLVSGW